MFRILFHHAVKRQRQKLNKTQAELAHCLGITRSRLAQLESGIRVPTNKEKSGLDHWLGGSLYSLPVRPKAFHRRLLANANSFLEAKPFFPPRDRPWLVRLKAARKRYPRQAEQALEILSRRHDFLDFEYFVHQLSVASYAECLHILQLLQRGGVPALCPPLGLDWIAHPIVCPQTRERVGHRAFPCIVLGDELYFIQVSMLIRSADRVFTVDVLKWNGAWSVIEIDGEGHSHDPKREAAIDLPTIHITPAQLLAFWS